MPTILAIESSCDETSAAICRDGNILSNFIADQKVHEAYGGVVPELASRAHMQHIVPVVDSALQQAGISLRELDGIAFTHAPGLIGSLLVGGQFAKSLALSLQLPLIAVHHMQAHVLANLIEEPRPSFPFLCLTVSGGHTQIVLCESPTKLRVIGETIDDAAGEAFDKTAKLLGLDYPGGAALSKLAESGKNASFDLPRPMLHSKDLDFSFSGLKTAVLHQVKKAQSNDCYNESFRANLACAFVEAVTDVLSHKAMVALEQMECRDLVVAGGVGANTQLRKKLTAMATARGYQVHYPPIELCTDNGVMIAFAGALRLLQSSSPITHGAFDIKPRWDLSSLNTGND